VDLLVPSSVPASSREPEAASFTLAAAASDIMSEISSTGAPTPAAREERSAAESRSRSRGTDLESTGLAALKRWLPGAVILAAAVSGTLLGRSFTLSNGTTPRATVPEDGAARATEPAEAALGSLSAPLPPEAVPVELFSMPAPHVVNEAVAADAWLLGQRERARALYEGLAARAPNARAYALVLLALERRTERTSEVLVMPAATPPQRISRSVPPVEIAVVVRSRGEAHVPLRLDGELIGDTGAAGVLHLHVRAPEGRELALELDTREVPGLSPPSPRRSVRVERASPVQSFDVTFETPRRPAAKPTKRPPQRPAPYRMD
jgi:hypothetical protein